MKKCGVNMFKKKCSCKEKNENVEISELVEKSEEKKEKGKSKVLTTLLCIFFGCFGFHRFYLGKIVTGLLWLFTLGFLGIGTFIDLVRICMGRMKDKQGRRLEEDITKKGGLWVLLFMIFHYILVLLICFTLIFGGFKLVMGAVGLVETGVAEIIGGSTVIINDIVGQTSEYKLEDIYLFIKEYGYLFEDEDKIENSNLPEEYKDICIRIWDILNETGLSVEDFSHILEIYLKE